MRDTETSGAAAAALEREFPLTSAEKARLQAAPFQSSPADWAAFAIATSESVLTGYECGEITFRGAIEVVHSCAIGCIPAHRVFILGRTAHRLLRIKPKERNAKRPLYPAWVKKAAVELVALIREKRPDLPLRTSSASSSSVFQETIKWLIALTLSPAPPAKNARPIRGRKSLATPLSEDTLHRWHQEYGRQTSSGQRRGRPRKE
jgi:hypothetical protein